MEHVSAPLAEEDLAECIRMTAGFSVAQLREAYMLPGKSLGSIWGICTGDGQRFCEHKEGNGGDGQPAQSGVSAGEPGSAPKRLWPLYCKFIVRIGDRCP